MKKLMTITGASAIAAVTFGLNGAALAQEIQLRFADQLPLTHIASAAGNQPFMEQVEAETDGRVTFRHFPAEQLAKGASMLDTVQNGVSEIAFVGVSYVSDRLPLTGAVELPGLFDNVIDGHAAFEALVRNELADTFEQAGLKPLWTMTTPPYQLMLRQSEPIEGLADLSGQQLRVAGATGQLVAAALGATPATIPTADLYQSLERGIVDGSLYTLSAMRSYTLQEVTQSYTTNAKLGGVAFIAFMNLNTWNSLPADVQEVIERVGLETGVNLAQAIDVTEVETVTFLEEMGKTVYPLSAETVAEFDAALATVQDEWARQMAERNLPGQEMLDAFAAYLAE